MGRRLILSRKGFDSGFGGRPSPVFEDGTIVSLPIPDDGSALRYSACRAPTGDTYQELLLRLGIDRIRYPAGAGRVVSLDVAEDPGVHLDPDLFAGSLPRAPGWRPLFGQVDRAQTHLERQGVGPGDLFLFFGWFSPVESRDGGLRYRPRRLSVQAVFGWLEVEEVVQLDHGEPPPWARQHPHVAARALPRYRNNTLYVAAETSSLVPGLPGAGVLSWRADRQLTKPGASPSTWRLPRAFHPDHTPAPLTHHPREAWVREGEHAVVRSARIGQEFVVEMTAGTKAWAAALLEG